MNWENMFDFERLEEISGGDLEFQREILEAFLEDSRETLVRVRQSWQTQDAGAIADGAHQIKGSSSNVGASSIQKIALELERQAKQGNLSDTLAAIEGLEEQLDGVSLFIRERLSV
ncbi:Hpt domain-containing protein [Oxynema sp. CENA135]|uniref:Hpt domain-containing protein n=1 Tax=Oxynema sp. CENA135 TaxID=984206 RepID=UPI00190BD6D0|nr:Hpt domain-containing protein [Oxynema sp. CENA135]MBK4732272.1 Hpt domain-containing protein [Oxynema sp. CENA135]